tara:strand:- start:968 stop:2470 length:1503 start_codon:yes stop_codon:yes gene_type:complete
MAAFSGTFTGSTSSSKIDVTAGTGTLAQLQADVDGVDPGIFTVAGGDPYTYTVLGNRELELDNNVTLNMQNKDDILQWTLTSAKYPILDIQSGAIFNVGDGTETGSGQNIKGDSAAAKHSYFYVYGSLNLQGTESSPIVIEDYRSMYIWTYDDPTDICDWDWVTLQNTTYSSGYILIIEGYGHEVAPQHTFDNVTISDDGGDGRVYMFYTMDYSNASFNNITIDNTDRCYFYGGGVMKFVNSTFKNIDNYGWLFLASSSALVGNRYVTDSGTNYSGKYEQPIIVFDNCTFDSNGDASTKYGVGGVARGSTVLFRDCTFNDAAYGVYAHSSGRALYHGTNTFTSITTADRRWSNTGTHLHVRTLDLTVYDENGDYLNNARVNVRQKEGKETWDFLTKSHTSSDPSVANTPDHDGQISNVFGDFPVFVEKEETSTGVFTQWSNGGDQVHELTVSYPGYVTHHEELKFTSDLVVEVTMELDPGTVPNTATKIYNSTLYNTTLY